MKAKILNAPERIFLQIAGDHDGPEDTDYNEVMHTGEVTWHDERIFDADVEYRIVKRRSTRSDKVNE
jgi:hypothetical protein